MTAAGIATGFALGGLIGVVGPLLAQWIQTRHQRKQMLWQAAIDAARYDHSTYVQALKDMNGAGAIQPLFVHINYYAKILEAIIDGGKLTPEKIAAIDKETDTIVDSIRSMEKIPRTRPKNTT